MNKNRGVAQLVERVVWDHQAAGSSPVTPTKFEPKHCISAWVHFLKTDLYYKKDIQSPFNWTDSMIQLQQLPKEGDKS